MGADETRNPKSPDVLVTQKQSPVRLPQSSASTAATPDLTLEILHDIREANTIVIYKLDSLDAEIRNVRVAAIELLSPANKVALQKREYLLKTGLRVVEIDILHALPSLFEAFERFPAYPTRLTIWIVGTH